MGCDGADVTHTLRRPDFNPRTPVGCDRKNRSPKTFSCYFNPRTPVGCDPVPKVLTGLGHDFNPRTPVGCDGYFIALSQAGQVFQSTHPSGVRPGGYGSISRQTVISIHAPQWGATLLCPYRFRGDAISIHAPQWGATQWSFDRRLDVLFQSTHPSGVRPAPHRRTVTRGKFQSTHPSGVRRVGRILAMDDDGISIHAPQWGATAQRLWERALIVYFNPRTPVGCDLAARKER